MNILSRIKQKLKNKKRKIRELNRGNFTSWGLGYTDVSKNKYGEFETLQNKYQDLNKKSDSLKEIQSTLESRLQSDQNPLVNLDKKIISIVEKRINEAKNLQDELETIGIDYDQRLEVKKKIEDKNRDINRLTTYINSYNNLIETVSIIKDEEVKKELFKDLEENQGNINNISNGTDKIYDLAKTVFKEIASEIVKEEGKEFKTEKNIGEIVGYLNLSPPAYDAIEISKKGQVSYVEKRISLLKKFIKSVKERVEKDKEQLLKDFGLDTSSLVYDMTGSDTHNDGEMVMILKDKIGKRVVYKPRTLQADRMLMGEDGVFAMEQFKELNLPTAKFLERSQDENKYSYMEHFSPERELTKGEADNFYKKMGVLKIVSKYLGVNDLHKDNVMVTKKGDPIIIDAETTFLPHVLLSENINKTELKTALTEFNFNGKNTSNTFRVKGEEKNHDETQLAQERFVKDSRYDKKHKEGQNEAIQIIKNMSTENLNNMIDKIKEAGEVRLVPLATADFQLDRMQYSFLDSQDDKEEVLNDMTVKIVNSIINDGYSISLDANKIIKDQLMKDYEQGDIPYFTFNTADFTVKYGGEEVGKFEKMDNYKDLIQKSKETLKVESSAH